MKRTSLLASLLILCSVLTVIAVNVDVGKANPTPSISVEPAKVTGKTGDTFTVDFIATDLSDCYVWQIFVQYNTSILSYSRWWEGPYLKGNPALTLQSYAYYNDTNNVNLPNGPPNWGKLFDKSIATYSDFQYSEVDGYYTLYKFGVDPVSPDSIIKRVDINMVYEAAASTGGDMYRIVYSTSSSAKKTLVDWTSDGASPGTYVWDDLEAPTADGWQWTEDVDGLLVSVETDMVGGDTSAVFKWYEVWLTVVYERPTTMNTDVKISGVIIGAGILGSYVGTYGSGLLGTMEFTILSEGNTAIDIGGGAIKLTYYTKHTAPGTAVYVTTENGYFFEPWPEDVYPDGIIDIRDIAIVGINYGKLAGGEFTGVPSTWTPGAVAWINPGNVVGSENAYASSQKSGGSYSSEIYGGYGFSLAALTITKVEVGIELYGAGGLDSVDIKLSNDGGSTWGPTHTVLASVTEGFTWIDTTSDFAWTSDMLSDSNFKVEMAYHKGGGGGAGATVYVDYLPVRVTQYSEVEGDVDGSGLVDIMDLSMVAIKYGEIYL